MVETQIRDKRIELKYLVDPKLSLEIRSWAREHLGSDEFCNDDLGDSYDVNTLYLDTPELDLFHRTSQVGRAKHRIRRYGDEGTLWVETKRKKKCVVKKNRTATTQDEVVSHLSQCNSESESEWCGDWFATRVAERRMRPTIQVHYRRFARTSNIHGENLRLTIDSHMETSPARDWRVACTSDRNNRSERVKSTEVEVLELKFHNHMPPLFKELLRTYSIPTTGFSKYRTSVHRGMKNDSWAAELGSCEDRPMLASGALSNA